MPDTGKVLTSSRWTSQSSGIGMKQGLAQDRLVTFEKAVDVGQKITDPKLRELFLQGLRSSLETSKPYPERDQIGLGEDKTK